MSSERILVALLVVVAILAAIPQMPAGVPWGMVLVILGLIAGGMGNSGENTTERIVIYVAAVAVPEFSNSLDVIPVVGHLVNHILDNMATGIQGMAVAVFACTVYRKLT